jgi:hypothetical protein
MQFKEDVMGIRFIPFYSTCIVPGQSAHKTINGGRAFSPGANQFAGGEKTGPFHPVNGLVLGASIPW